MNDHINGRLGTGSVIDTGSSLLLNLVRNQKIHSGVVTLTYMSIITGEDMSTHMAYIAAWRESLTPIKTLGSPSGLPSSLAIISSNRRRQPPVISPFL